MSPILEAIHIDRTFEVSGGFFGERALLKAVQDVSFGLEPGESLGLVGESGCGKSTLGRVACGLIPPSAGHMELEGKRLPVANGKSWARGKIQMVFQDPVSSLDPRLPIGKSVAEPLLAMGDRKGVALEKAAELLKNVGLGGMDRRYPHQFSGGQRQRIAIARALATRPEVMVCDEPVSALDASVQAQILNLLKDMQEQYGTSFLFISHDLAVIGFMCKRVMVMYLGQIVEKAETSAIFAGAAHPYSRALVAAMPQGQWAKKEGVLPPPLSGELPSPLNPPSGCYFHPRCPIAQPICSVEAPPWKIFEPGWEARCHFPVLRN